ncbi:hypothetical protein [Candidatus Marimicrobium litorale]|uniref:Uncharacterized protein n=1 Tax=Candidatus Marimicrobium litorale TaxID=2518991 RepID=A0ABT3T9B3_9GAMM|nr:hypothetical protein [Candidatus Marimicrobium litorale]MCX2978883.1 hypothetical protein [Candidatus Marimicrobium litorale]
MSVHPGALRTIAAGRPISRIIASRDTVVTQREGAGFSMWLASFLITLTAIVSLPALATGKGSIGLWPASERHVLVIDKTIPGLVLVDLTEGVAVERVIIPSEVVVGVTSCQECDFALVGSSRGDFWRVQFSGKVADLLSSTGRLGLADAEIKRIHFKSSRTPPKDSRMMLLDEGGKTAYIASLKDDEVFRASLGPEPRIETFYRGKRLEPFGLNWGREDTLLLTLHKKTVMRLNREGEVLAVYNTRRAGCPGTDQFKPNMRAAFDDPLNENSILILASNPKSYDAVVWRLTYEDNGKERCESVVSKIGRDTGWVDGAGDAVFLGRSHHFVLRPGRAEAIISDTDNRALRTLDLATETTRTVMYDRDRLLAKQRPERTLSSKDCKSLGWALLPAGGLPDGSCIQNDGAESEPRLLEAAEKHCQNIGGRLCEPNELVRSGRVSAPIWTRARCASCWMRKAHNLCELDIKTYKSPGLSHRDKAFAQSWDSGHAQQVSSKNGGSTTFCEADTLSAKALVHCCADSQAGN